MKLPFGSVVEQARENGPKKFPSYVERHNNFYQEQRSGISDNSPFPLDQAPNYDLKSKFSGIRLDAQGYVPPIPKTARGQLLSPTSHLDLADQVIDTNVSPRRQMQGFQVRGMRQNLGYR